MKRLLRILVTLVAVLLVIAGCTGGGSKEETYDLKERTFYNQNDPWDSYDHAKVYFAADGTFVLTENSQSGSYEIKGNWTVSDKTCTLEVTDGGQTNIEGIIFEIESLERIILKTNIDGSKSGDLFSVDEIKGTNKPVEGPNGTAPEGDAKSDLVLYNASQKARGEFGYSKITLTKDGDFTMEEVMGMGAIELVGKYGTEGPYYMFANFDPFSDPNGNNVYNFELEKISEGVFVIQETLQGSQKGDYFTTDGNLPKGVVVNPPAKNNSEVYVHGPIEGTLDEYLPKVKFFEDGTFIFTENVYEGFGTYKGTYTKDMYGYACTVTDNSSMKGFAGQDVTEMFFEFFDAKTITLQQDLCMSRAGDTFSLSE